MMVKNDDRLKFTGKNATALLVVDVQRGLFSKSVPIYRADALLANINHLADQAHEAGSPVFYIQHSEPGELVKGSLEWQLHSSLQPINSDYAIYKVHGNAFEDTPLDKLMKSRHVSSVVVTGLLTHACVRATCLGARKLGYHVILVSDGHSNYSRQAAGIVDKWNQKLVEKQVEVKPTVEIEF